jgi:Bacterial PH domain
MEWQVTPMSSQADEAPIRGAAQPETVPGVQPESGSGVQPESGSVAQPQSGSVAQPQSGSAVRPESALEAAPAAGRRPALRGTASVGLPWRAAADGKAVFRRGGPLALWWLWVAFAVFNFADVAVRDHDYFSYELTAGLLVVTAVAYACALRPRVVADDEAIRVYNPYRDHLVRWGALNGVFLGESVELACARPNPKKDKTIYCWALYSGRRSRRRGQLRAERREARVTWRTAAEIGQQKQPDAVNLMAAELGRRSADARQRAVPPATIDSRWAWLPVAYLLVPAALLLGLVLAR